MLRKSCLRHPPPKCPSSFFIRLSVGAACLVGALEAALVCDSGQVSRERKEGDGDDAVWWVSLQHGASRLQQP